MKEDFLSHFNVWFICSASCAFSEGALKCDSCWGARLQLGGQLQARAEKGYDRTRNAALRQRACLAWARPGWDPQYHHHQTNKHTKNKQNLGRYLASKKI